MNSIERVEAVLAGKHPDRAPVSFWRHFQDDQVYGPAAVAAHLSLLETYELDFLKVMNDNPYPHHAPVRTVADLKSIQVLQGNEPEFQHQLDLLRELHRHTQGKLLMASTIFNAWSVLRHLVRRPTQHLPPDLDAAADAPSRQIKEMVRQDEKTVAEALGRIGQSLANFARRCLDAGADGIFLSARDDWAADAGLPGLYARLVRPTDMQVLAGAYKARFNILHVCGKGVDFRAFAQYPVAVINWADRYAGPSIAEVKDWIKPAICAGVDNLHTLSGDDADEVEREVFDALNHAGKRPIMISPGCTFDPSKVPASNLRAMVHAVQRHHGR